MTEGGSIGRVEPRGGLRRYRLAEPLGAGGQGTVYAAFDTELARPVAIKLVRDDKRADPEARARLLREARAMASVAHPNVVAIHDVGTFDADEGPAGGGVYIVMERISGPDLQAWLASESRPWPAILDVFVQAAHGVRAAHAAGLVHRDLKPSNIVVGSDGRTRVLDFGIARTNPTTSSSPPAPPPPAAPAGPPSAELAAADTRTLTPVPEPPFTTPPADTLTAQGQLLGTPRYMAPEHHAGIVDARSDVFSFSASLFEALYRRPAFTGGTGADLARAKRAGEMAPRPADTTVPAWLDRIVRRGLAPDPDDRFPSMGAWIEAVHVAQRRARRPRALLIAGVALAVGVGAVAGWPRAPAPEATAAAPDPAVTPDGIAVLPFEDRTDDPELSFAREGLPEIVGRELEAAGVHVVPYWRLASHVERDDDASAWRRAAQTLGAGALVRGSLERSGDEIALSVVLEDPDGAVLARVDRREAEERLPAAVREAAAQLASQRFGHPAQARTGAPSLDFERAFQSGLARLEVGDHAAAEEHFRAAVRFAPESGPARFYLALAAWWSDRPPETITQEIDLALAREDLDEAQRRFLAGLGHLVERDYARAIETFERRFATDPEDRYCGYGLFEAQYHGASAADAMATYRRLGAAWPRFSLGLLHVLEYSLLQRDDATLSWALERAHRVHDPLAGLWEARERVGAGDLAGARDRLRALEAARPDQRALLDVERLALHLRAGELSMASTLAAQLEFESPAHARMLRLAVARLAGRPDPAASEAIALGLISQSPGGARADQALQLLALELPGADTATATRLAAKLEDQVADETHTHRSVELARALLAAAGARAAREPDAAFPEVRALRRAVTLEGEGQAGAAAAAWRDVLRETIHPALHLVASHRAATWQAAHGDPRETIDLCAGAVDPAVLHWSWAAVVAPCLELQAAALERLDDPDRALAARARRDQLVASARAAVDSPRP